MIESLAIILVAINLLALVSGLLCSRWPVAGLGIPLALYLLVQQAWWQIPRAVETWRSGGATLLVPYESPVPDHPDPELRLPWEHPWMETVSPTGIWLHNATLWVLDRTIRPAVGAWQGEIPSLAAAQSRLDVEGQDVLLTLAYDGALRARGGAEPARGVLHDGTQVEVFAGSKDPCGEGADGTLLRRVARLDAEALLMSCGAQTWIFATAAPDLPYRSFWPLYDEASPSAALDEVQK